VEQEAQLVRNYLTIVQTRLGARMSFAIDVDPAVAGQPLPPGILLSLVENAVEHGITPCLSGGVVQVRAGKADDRVWIEVGDSGAGLSADAIDGVGMANSRERLRNQFSGRASLTLSSSPDGERTIARIEILNQPDKDQNA
jgi:sensor histidine kinase YesM